MCVCVFFPFILDIKFVGRTSRGHTGGRSHRISHPPSFCGACLNFSREKRIQPFLSLLDREIDFCVINDTLARSLEPVVTECKEHTIHTQTQVVASRKPKKIKRTHEGEANLTT